MSGITEQFIRRKIRQGAYRLGGDQNMPPNTRRDGFALTSRNGFGGAGKQRRVVASSGYRYYRFYRASSYSYIFEFELFAASTAPGYLTDNASDLCYGLGSAAAIESAHADSSVKPEHAYNDNGVTSGWGTYAGQDNAWVGVDLGTAQVVHSLNVRVWEGSGAATFEGSNDLSAWTTLHSFAAFANNTTYTVNGL
jgi:hypothetical protein